jgi:5-methylcytosine-specific restriction endonuclease McrA
MNTVTSVLARMSESELLHHFQILVARDRRTTTQMLVAISEIDERKLWASHACPSMFAFCVERFHMSEQVTAKRIWAARTARRFPVVLEMIERGELHLSAICLLARHLTEHNCRDVLQRAIHKSSREIERLVAELAPRPDVASRVRALPRRVVDTQGVAEAVASGDGTTREAVDTAQAASGDGTTHLASASAGASTAAETRSELAPAGATGLRSCPVQSRGGSPVSAAATRSITALSPRRYKIEITVDEETHDKLRSLQDLLGRSTVGRDPAAIISRAIDGLLVDTLKRKAATTDRRRPACHASPKNPRPRSRSIPAALRRAVWQRDCGRCRFVDDRGRRCNATSNVEFHHKDPFARGGRHDADNVELRCTAHNQYQADLDFGQSFMDARRSAGSRS